MIWLLPVFQIGVLMPWPLPRHLVCAHADWEEEQEVLNKNEKMMVSDDDMKRVMRKKQPC